MAEKFQLKALISGVDKLSPMLAGMRKNVAQFRKQLKTSSLGDKISFGEIMKGGAIAAPFVLGAKAAIDFESAMADVKKVVNFDTPEQFKQMCDDVMNLSRRLPMAAKDIAAIIAAGGQAGFDKSELARFAEDAVKMGVAFDQSADESGTMMAKWRTSFKMGQDQVVELADKINYLGNNGPATAKQISSIVTRIGPLGQVAGLASGQIAAMGATLAGMGIQEEVAATGMKNFMLALTAGSSATKQQQNAFKSLRLDAKQLAVGMQKDAQGTLLRVLTAVGKVDKSKQASVLQQLFGKESIEAIAPLLTNMELLRGNLEKVAQEQQYGGSMQQEYAARAATTANNIQLFTNRVVGLGVSMGNILLPSINSFLGVRNVDAKLFDVARVLEFSRYQQIVKVILPGAMPNILLGIRLSLSVSWLCLVVAELMGADEGVGYLIQDARAYLRTGVVFVGIFIFAIVGKLTDSLVRILEARLLKWQDSYRG